MWAPWSQGCGFTHFCLLRGSWVNTKYTLIIKSCPLRDALTGTLPSCLDQVLYVPLTARSLISCLPGCLLLSIDNGLSLRAGARLLSLGPLSKPSHVRMYQCHKDLGTPFFLFIVSLIVNEAPPSF